MPEGPEIRIEADRIARVLEGERIEDLFLGPPALRRFSPRLKGATVVRIDTHGKAMLTRFGNGLTLYSHNQLYGRWYSRAPGDLPTTNRKLRIALHTRVGSAFLYSATDIEVLDQAAIDNHPFLCRLGPDILDPALTWQALATRLDDPRFRTRSLASLYLDQSFVAGLGNYLRSEILHFAALAHARKAESLSRAERQRLARQTIAIAQRSYRTRGVTNSPARVAARKAAGDVTRARHRFAVFARQGRPCDICGSGIARGQAAGRRIYYCPSCQR